MKPDDSPIEGVYLDIDYTVEQQREIEGNREFDLRTRGLSLEEKHLLRFGDKEAWARQGEREAKDPSLQYGSIRDLFGNSQGEEKRQWEEAARLKWSQQRTIQNATFQYLLNDPNLILYSAWGDPEDDLDEVHAYGPYLLQSRWPGAVEAAEKIVKLPIFADKPIVVSTDPNRINPYDYPSPPVDPPCAEVEVVAVEEQREPAAAPQGPTATPQSREELIAAEVLRMMGVRQQYRALAGRQQAVYHLSNHTKEPLGIRLTDTEVVKAIKAVDPDDEQFQKMQRRWLRNDRKAATKRAKNKDCLYCL